PGAGARRPRPPGGRGRGRGRAGPPVLALAVAVPATAGAAMLVSAPRAPGTVAPPTGTHAEPTPSPPRREARPPAAAVTDALGRLRPIVNRGYSTGQIRSDVALDLTNVITNLENDLTADRAVDLEQRIEIGRAHV